MNQLKDVNYLSDIIQVIEAVGGVPSAVCASFLSQLEVYDEDIGLVARTNTAQHKCVLFRIDFENFSKYDFVGTYPVPIKPIPIIFVHKIYCAIIFLHVL